MKIIKILWYYIEIWFVKLMLLMGVEKDKSVIPKGQYCYESIEFPSKNNNYTYKVKPCKYYRSVTKYIKSCIYEGYIGHDVCLWDQCKICGENYNFHNENEDLVD